MIEIKGAYFGGFAQNTAARVSSTTQSQQIAVAMPGEWTIFSNPGAGATAIASKAAGGAGVRHVLRSAEFTVIDSVGVAATFICAVRDGPSGTGTLLFTYRIAIPASAGSFAAIIITDLNVVGSVNTSMTIEFTGAGGASNFQTVNAAGYSTI